VYFSNEHTADNTDITVFVKGAPVIKNYLGQEILQFKAAIPKGIGESDSVTCKSLQTGIFDKITPHCKITLRGIIKDKSFKKDNETIHYKILEVEDFLHFEEYAAPESADEIGDDDVPF
jgi:hypothetical protein